ncbi:MAG: hypothetical protein JWM28_4498 [Chitinophagaceae bacterium]|nr:hypothetical protein [Chitinophagaceae bacterium]
MDSETTKNVSAAILPLKDRIFNRFVVAKGKVGADWRNKLAESDSFFNTKKGADYMQSVARGMSNKSLVSADRFERVTLALEKIAGIDGKPL